MFVRRRALRNILPALVAVIILIWIGIRWRTGHDIPQPPQYFREVLLTTKSRYSGLFLHCDRRFFRKAVLTRQDVQVSLNRLMRSYSEFITARKIESWLAHGSLLGWLWTGEVFPWDTDIDVHISKQDLWRLAKTSNMSEFSDSKNNTFVLDINPNSREFTVHDDANKIDARWIDTLTGLSIDITTTHMKSTFLYCKDGHRYKYSSVYPLQETSFEGVPIYVPSDYREILRNEFGRRALVKENFHWHRFNQSSQLWEPERQAGAIEYHLVD